jgi:hypothetical protein
MDASQGLGKYMATPEGVAQLVEDVGAGQARDLVRQTIAQELNAGGPVTPQKLKQVFGKYGDKVAALDRATPDEAPMAGTLRNVERAQKLADQVAAQQKIRQQMLASTETKGVVATPQGQDTMRRISSASVRKLADNKELLAKAGMAPADVKRLGKIADTLDRMEQSNSGSRFGRVGSDTQENSNIGAKFKKAVKGGGVEPEGGKAIFDYLAAQIGERVTETAKGGIIAGVAMHAAQKSYGVLKGRYNKSFNETVANMLANPEFAKDMLSKYSPVNMNRVRNRWGINLIPGAIAAPQQAH